MSILMAALKRQNHTAPTTADGGAYWRKLALVLALLLALLIGAVAAYLLMPLLQPAEQAKPIAVAQPAAILAALDSTTSNVIAVAPAQLDTALDKVISPAVATAPVTEQFTSLPAVKTLTAGTKAAEPQTKTAAAAEQASSKPAIPEPAPAEVSAELREIFASALKATEHNSNVTARRSNDAPATDIRSLDLAQQRLIPEMRFDAHVYATAVNQRWVKVNGKTLQQGQWVTADIRIKEITPQYVLLERGDLLFSMAALSSWPD